MADALNAVIAAIVALYFVMIGGYRRYSAAALIGLGFIIWIAVFLLLTWSNVTEGIMK